MKNGLKVFWSVIGLSLVVLIVLSGCAPKQAAPPTTVKPSEIVIPLIHDISGPYGASNVPAAACWGKAYPKWYNAQGGLDGVPIRVEILDTRGDEAAAVAAYSKVREWQPKPLMCCVFRSNDVDLLGARLAEDKIPCMASAVSQTAVWPPGGTFCINGASPDFTAGFLDWLSEKWSKDGETRKCRLALFNPDYASGRNCATAEVLEYAKTKPNIEVVANEFFDYKALDLSSDILRVMQNEPDWIYGFYFASSGVAFFKSLDATGFRGKVNVANTLWGMGPELSAMVGPDLMEGVVGPHFIPPLLPKGQKQPTVALEFVEKMLEEGNYPTEYRAGPWPAYVAIAAWLTNGLEKALEDVGWEKLDGTAVYNAYASTREMDLLGITMWGTAEGTRTNNKFQIYEFQNGIPMPITEFKTVPDLRPPEFRTKEYNWSAAGWPEGWFK